MVSDSPQDEDASLAASFGKCVTRHREAAGVSMSELAKAAGMSRAYLWRLEQGDTLPGLRNVARLSVALGVPVSRLTEGLDTSGMDLRNRPYRTGDDAP
ncbi:helix-turn-helix domain-containing protein [Qipengyuania flava]|uniref:helix-turn-helix domain-containing protein n=1 Tax=Qipengyuania flava TaxID=192812 RepID=UPI001CD3D837|nr:helix-turn-helix transcriptional regulator [Qipengyuania flava]MCA0891252.1 helix-turn-helix domain-containing protein [Qipengyuania flava]